MNHVNETYFSVSGEVTTKRVKKAGQGAETVLDVNNLITYSMAGALARLVGGDTRYQATHVAFIYLPVGQTLPVYGRDSTWASIAAEVANAGGNAIVCKTMRGASYETAGSPEVGPDVYSNNAVTITAVSDETAAIAWSGGGFTPSPPTPGVHTYVQAVMLSQIVDRGIVTNLPMARVNLTTGGTGLPVQTDSDLAVFWKITFK